MPKTSKKRRKSVIPDAVLEACILSCLRCQKACTETERYCLELGEEHSEKNHILLMRDCAALCGLTASFFARDSVYRSDLAEVCARVCEECAISCESFRGDATMKKCAIVCRKTAECCTEIA